VQGLGPEDGTGPRSSGNDTLFAPTVFFMSPKGLAAPRVSLVLKMIKSTRITITPFAALEWVFLRTDIIFDKERVLTRDGYGQGLKLVEEEMARCRLSEIVRIYADEEMKVLRRFKEKVVQLPKLH
jgi:hypothetical protein